MGDYYVRRSQGRRPLIYLALGVGMAALYLSLTLEVSKLVPVLAALYLALVVRRVVQNRAQGFRLGSSRIDWFTPKGTESAALDDIEGVAIGRGVEGETVCVLSLTDGRVAPLLGVEKLDPERLTREFGIRGVPVRS